MTTKQKSDAQAVSAAWYRAGTRVKVSFRQLTKQPSWLREHVEALKNWGDDNEVADEATKVAQRRNIRRWAVLKAMSEGNPELAKALAYQFAHHDIGVYEELLRLVDPIAADDLLAEMAESYHSAMADVLVDEWGRE